MLLLVAAKANAIVAAVLGGIVAIVAVVAIAYCRKK